MESFLQGIRISLIGAGGFSHFSVEAFLKVPGVSITGVFDINKENAQSFAEKFNCRIFQSQEELLADNETDIVYITTPPYLHYQNSKDSLIAGKHVICEKPAAFHAKEVKELIGIAKNQNLLYVVNLMQRYNPLYPMVKSLVEQKLLGEFLHGYFENYASDETLDEDHWMWDEEKSGGIFIEHAVHFFDLKYSIYQQLLTDMLADQVKWLKNRNHLRRITELNALNSTRMAEESNKSAILI